MNGHHRREKCISCGDKPKGCGKYCKTCYPIHQLKLKFFPALGITTTNLQEAKQEAIQIIAENLKNKMT